MSLLFEWDEGKARTNEKKHGVTFFEAASVFRDPLAVTIFDPLHSGEEDRFVSLGESHEGRLLVVVFTERDDNIRLISAREATRRRGRNMKKGKNRRDPEMLDEYDFSGGVRGKYAERFAEGTNLVVLAPDVAAVFPDSASVNEALRTLVRIGRTPVRKAPRTPKK